MNIEEAKITSFSVESLVQAGLNKEDAALVTETMLIADYRGIHSHGFIRLPIYLERIKKGLINAQANIEVIKDSPALSLLDGDFGPGQVVATKAMQHSIKNAKKSGLGLTVVKNSNHFGIAAYYNTLATNENLIGIVISNVEPLMPAVGGADKVIGNNPISIAAPNGGNDPILLDMALSNVPLGKILVYQSNGEPIPMDWGVDKNGLETSNPNDVIDGGFLLPMAGPKGFGLAVLTEVLTGIISGGQYSKTIESMYHSENKQSISHFMLAIDPTFFMDLEEYNQRVNDLTSFVKASKKAEHTSELFMPGEIEFKREKANREKGVPIEENLYNQLLEISKTNGIAL
ncbi:Ldh family oxidoreductase [Chryseomicrobium aureum]|uniref:Ldh family oxidoreductase n=1 Tax=Chryseomicrobium aureum TaxID=1441723 RepID=UPI00370D4E91